MVFNDGAAVWSDAANFPLSNRSRDEENEINKSGRSLNASRTFVFRENDGFSKFFSVFLTPRARTHARKRRRSFSIRPRAAALHFPRIIASNFDDFKLGRDAIFFLSLLFFFFAFLFYFPGVRPIRNNRRYSRESREQSRARHARGSDRRRLPASPPPLSLPRSPPPRNFGS